MKGVSFTELREALTHKTKYMYHCPNCNHGPFYTKGDETTCPACEKKIRLTRTSDGDIVIEVVKN